MQDDNRDWRDSNAPKWVKEAVQKELDAWRLTSALSWPTEPRPSPVPFCWGDYDRLVGEPIPGTYWTARAERFEMKKQDGKTGEIWKSWIFKTSGGRWHTLKQRGPLFDNERDARLWMLWDECENSAKKLMQLRAKL